MLAPRNSAADPVLDMKRCPTCNKTFTDQNLSFCIEDGTPLVPVADSADETTVVSPQSGRADAPTEAYVPRDWQRDYQPPGSFEPPGQKRRVWPWVAGIAGALLVGLIGVGIALTLLAPKMFRRAVNSNANVTQAEPPSSSTIPNTDNSNTSANDNSVEDDGAPAPTDKAEVLSDLTDIENDWTVANINADKRKLDYILADDYVGTASDGRSQGKGEYLKTIERDTSIEKWDFEGLQVTLRGDRATLTGRIRIRVSGKEVLYNFTDKFVWREARWQAVSSEVQQAEKVE